VSAPSGGSLAPDRRLAIDWVRGLAVLIMLLAHVLDAWTRPSERATTAFHYLNILAGFAAPFFLWLAGVALVLSGERELARGGGVRAARDRLIARGLGILIFAFAFRLLMFLFNPGGSAIGIFRVDILNIMGPSIAIAAIAWGAVRRPSAQIVMFAAASFAISLLTPIVRSASWVMAMPVWIQWYLRPSGGHTLFTLFPWAGFVFAGGAVGSLIAHARAPLYDRRSHLAVGGCGVALIAVGSYASTLPTIYRQSSFWSSSPTFFIIRVGVLMVTLMAAHWLAGPLGRRGVTLEPLQRLGRASLFIYAVHIPIVYGWMTQPFRSHLAVWPMVAAFGAFSIAMYALVLLWERVVTAWFSRDQADPGRGLTANTINT
jgi:uncharacterized membrane protein